MREFKRKFNFKISVVGNGLVGKTSLIKKFTQGSFRMDYVKTIGAQFSLYDKLIEGDKIRLILWDIAGQDDFTSIRPSFFKNSKIAIIVYSLEENKLGEESFKHISDWRDEIIEHCGNIPIVIFANKADLIDEDNLANFNNQQMFNEKKYLGFYITSAKTGKGVHEAFNAIIDKLYHDVRALSAEL